MSDEGGRLGTGSEAAGRPRLRAVVIGCLMCALIGLAGPYWTIYLQTSRMFADYHTAGATFGLFLLFLVFNLGLGTLWKRLALRTDEMMAVGAMMLVGGSIVSSGLIAYFIPSISSAYNLANASNQWHTELWPYMPEGLAPLDPNGGTIAITRFWTGLRAGEPIPWGPWMQPLLIWGVFLMALFTCMMAIMTLMRKQWMDYEHLSFPIAQVPGELCSAAGDPLGPTSVFRSRAFWAGLAPTLLAVSLSGLSQYGGFPFLVRVRQTILPETPWELALYVDLVVVGLVMLIPNRIAFTVWSVALLSWFVRAYMQSYNLSLPDQYVLGSEMQHAAGGATIAFVVGTLWLSRGHLKRALRCAFGRGEEGYDRGEPTSYRMAFVLALISFAVTVVWLHRRGLGYFSSGMLILVTLGIYFAMARVVAQCGLPMLSPPIYPNQFMASMFGPTMFGRSEATVLASHYGWHFDMRNSVMSGSAHGMHLTRRRRSGLLWPMLLGLAVTYVAGSLCAIYVCYKHGGSNMDPWFFGNFPRLPWNWAQATMQHHGGPSWLRMVWGGAGLLLMSGLIVAQRTFFWWPLHPVGLLICSSHMVYYFWLSVFLAWLVKTLLITFGGPAMFRPARRFAIGMVMGYFLAGGIWAIVDTVFQSTGNAVFYI